MLINLYEKQNKQKIMYTSWGIGLPKYVLFQQKQTLYFDF